MMPVTLPHDWLIYNTHALYENREGWYRTTLSLAEVPAHQLWSLRFEGIYMNSTLYVNGQVAGEWKYGYSTFEFNITPYLTEGDNTIVMRVIHESPNSRWYCYGEGIAVNPAVLKRAQVNRMTELQSGRTPAFLYLKLTATSTVESAIEGIGNNVSLIFEGMDFGGQGSSRIIICGRSPLENSTLQLLFSGPGGDSKQLVEFAGSSTYTEREFVLEPVSGPRTVTLLFLPGSQIGLKWFRFLPAGQLYPNGDGCLFCVDQGIRQSQ